MKLKDLTAEQSAGVESIVESWLNARIETKVEDGVTMFRLKDEPEGTGE